MDTKGFRIRYTIPHNAFAFLGGRLLENKSVDEKTGEPIVPDFDKYEAIITSTVEFKHYVDYCTKEGYAIEIIGIIFNNLEIIPANNGASCLFKKEKEVTL